MKTKSTVAMIVVLLFFQLAITAQKLNGKIEKAVVQIGTTFKGISTERLLLLDQVAFSIFKKSENNQKPSVVFLDKTNQELSQLALVWLKTGMIYYGHQDLFSVYSAGIDPAISPMNGIASLDAYGFKVKNARGENPMSYTIKYGSGSWLVFPKSVQKLPLSAQNIFKINLKENLEAQQNKDAVELLISEPTEIAREMLYIATRLNYLITNDKGTK
ncbi:hypothetical protein ZORO111903_18455 [Zobellia roscoffensis]|uniref:hypothetical protein n=1 Tax=Zobellia roscoffensis TaxID=2779508 RepID=UPI00188DAC79|nr:hypothetical protein [Zobellia roscoffensis]